MIPEKIIPAGVVLNKANAILSKPLPTNSDDIIPTITFPIFLPWVSFIKASMAIPNFPATSFGILTFPPYLSWKYL